MAEFNPDEYLKKKSFDPDMYLSGGPVTGLENPDVPTIENLSLEQQRVDSIPERTFGEKIEGGIEAAKTLITGSTSGALAFGVGSVKGVLDELTGKLKPGEGLEEAQALAAKFTDLPESEAGKEYVKEVGEFLGVLPPILGTTPINTLKAAIPKRKIPKNIMKSPSMKKVILKREIAEGNPNIDTIAKTLNSEGDIITNKASRSALKTIGDTEKNRELISVIERLDPASKKQGIKMLDAITSKKKFPDLDVRPSDIVGDSIANRARAISIKNEQAGKRIGKIANSLKNKDVNIQKPVNDFFSELNSLGVTFKRGDDGWVTPDFSRSKFSGGNQKDMTVLINDLLNADTKFESSHKLKQDIRKNIDFDKLGANRMDRDSQAVLKKLSSGIDESLDNESTSYKKANEVFAKTVKLKDDFQKMAGKDIDLFDDISKEALANKARRLSSNAQSRAAIKQTLINSDEVLKSLGVNFKDNIHSLNFVVNRLDDLFKVTPETSMQGVIERGVDASFSPVAAARQGLETAKTALSASDAKKIDALKRLMQQK